MKKLAIIGVLFCIVIFDLQYAFSEENSKLIFAIDLVRHGDRTPVRYMPKISKAWTEDKIGKLTSLGEQQAQLLGKKFGEYYINEMNLLSGQFRTDDIYVRSTNFQRTQKTAQSILKGIYPTIEKIKIMVLPTKKDVLNPDRYTQKKDLAREKVIKEITKDTALISAVRQQLKNINHVFNTNFSTNTDKLYKISIIGDLIRVNQIHKKPFLKSLPKQAQTHIIDLGDRLELKFMTNNKISCIYGKDFLLHMADLLHMNHKQKYFLYVAHDFNFMAVLPLLDFKIENRPPYLSDLRFELFQDNKKGFLFVRMSFNGKVIKMCNSSENCPLAEFVGTLKDKVKNKCT